MDAPTALTCGALVTDAEQAPAPSAPCSPCRGTGRVISSHGGAPSELACPWCDGSGTRTLGHDAQAHWREPSPASAGVSGS